MFGTLVFPPGQTTQWVPVPLIDNIHAEGQEVFSLDLSVPVNATVAQRLTPATLIDSVSDVLPDTVEIVAIVGQVLPLDPVWFPDPGV